MINLQRRRRLLTTTAATAVGAVAKLTTIVLFRTLIAALPALSSFLLIIFLSDHINITSGGGGGGGGGGGPTFSLLSSPSAASPLSSLLHQRQQHQHQRLSAPTTTGRSSASSLIGGGGGGDGVIIKKSDGEGDEEESECPYHRLSQCFTKAYSVMLQPAPRHDTDNKKVPREQEVSLKQPIGAGCGFYELFVMCFSYSGCSVETSARIASLQYRRRTKGFSPISKETFLSILGHVRHQCSFGCSQESESMCRSRMPSLAQDKDQALLLEIRGQSRQIQLDMIPTSTGCSKLKRSLERWRKHRGEWCDRNSVLCQCQTIQRSIQKSCRLNCHTIPSTLVPFLPSAAGPSTTRYSQSASATTTTGSTTHPVLLLAAAALPTTRPPTAHPNHQQYYHNHFLSFCLPILLLHFFVNCRLFTFYHQLL